MEVAIRELKDAIRIYDVGDGVKRPSVTTITDAIDVDGKVSISRWRDNTKHSELIRAYAALTGTLVHYRAANFAASKWGIPRVPIFMSANSLEFDIMHHYLRKSIPVPAYRDRNVLYDVKRGALAYIQWFNDFNPQPPVHELGKRAGEVLNIYPLEHTVWHSGLEYAGTLDMLCSSADKVNWLIDLKYNDRLPAKYFLQVTAYRMALRMLHPTLRIPHMGVLNLRMPEARNDMVSKSGNKMYRFTPITPSNDLEESWMRAVGAYYYAFRNDQEIGVNAQKVLAYLSERRVRVI